MVSLLPKDQKFFEMFEKMTGTVVEGSKYLETLIADMQDLGIRVIRLKELEHEGDVITHQTVEKLNKTFLTPFDREDMHALSSNFDDILDWIEEAGQLLLIYKLTEPRDDARRMANTVTRAAEELDKAVKKLSHHQKLGDEIRRHLVEINRLENEGDMVYRQALSTLFDEEGIDPIKVLKWKEVYDALESAIDSCEKAANTIDSVLLKHA